MKTHFRLAATFLLTLGLITGCTDPNADKSKATIEDVEPEEVQVAAAPDLQAAPDDPQAAPPAEPAQPAQPAPAGDIYQLADTTYIGFAGSKIGGTHYGQFLGFDGHVAIPQGNIEQATINLTIDMTRAETDDSRLTGTLQGEQFFHVEEHPQATFQSTSIAKSDDGYTVTGNLTIRGVAKRVTFPAQITLDGDTLAATAEFTIDRTAWGIGEGWVSDTVINDDVLIDLDVQAEKQEGLPAASASNEASKTAGADGEAEALVDNFSQPREGSRPKDKE